MPAAANWNNAKTLAELSKFLNLEMGLRHHKPIISWKYDVQNAFKTPNYQLSDLSTHLP